MSMFNRDEAFICALKKNPNQRTNKDLEIIFSRLHRFEALSNLREQGLKKLCAEVRYEWHDSNEILYGKDDPCTCWFILLSGSIFIQGSMFLRNTSFGKRIPGTTSRGCQCLVLEPSEMIAIDYPEMHPPLHTVRVPDLRNHSTSSKSTLDSVAEANSSSVESSPKQNVSRKSSGTMANGQVQTDNTSDISKDSREYYINQEDSRSQDDPEQDDEDFLEEQEDSISLHSSSSFVIKDLVTDVLKKDISERNEDDHDVLLEFTRSLQAFSNMTEPTRRELCKVMVFAHVDKAGTELLKDNEALDSWSVIINGQVQIVYPDSDENNDTLLYMGESFGVTPSMQTQYHKGTMYTMVDDCQFLCIAQEDYCNVLHQGKENMENIMGEDGVVEMVKEKREIEGGRKGHIVIRGTPETLRAHLLEENSIDTTYAEDYLLTYRAFSNEPIKICNQLLEWFDREEFQAKVTRVILLWVNNHFNDFERDRHMMNLLEKFEEKLQTCNKTGQCKLFNIACSTKAKSKIITLSRSSNEEDLGFSITGGTDGYPIYILKVTANSVAEEKGLKRGDQLLNVNGQNFEKLNMERANAILRKNTDLTLTVKTNLFAFKEMMADIKNPQKKREKAKKGKHENTPVIAQILTMQPTKASRMPSITSEAEAYDGKTKKGAGTLGRRGLNKVNRVRSKMFQTKRDPSFREYLDQHGGMISETDAVAKDDSFLSALKNTKYQPGSAATVDGPRSFRQAAAHSSSNPDLLDPGCYVGVENPSLAEVPEDVIKVFRADQTYRFVFVNQDTTAEEAVRAACKEFGIAADSSKNYSLCRVTVQNETFVKQSKLPDTWSKLSEIPLSARYYLKNNMESEQLLPDENIPELLKEANYTFLDLNCFEVALHLTLQDYERFKTVEQTDFIDDLFHLNEESLTNFKSFEDLVNRELFWVVSTLCLEPNLLRRSKMLKHFTKIAHHCKALKNLNSTFAIISGLGYRAVSRMKASWEKVPAKVQRTFDDLQSLMDPSRNMSKYRTLLNELAAQPPALPYIPVVKKDLTFLHLGNDTKVDDLVNFEKMRMIGREVRNVCRLCSADSSQIISSAIAHNHEADRPSSNIYHTLTRKGRRSSFNNARKMYEDAVNARRVKQYMQQLDIEKDEDKLMEMSKQVEPSSVSSAQTKRRNAGSADSPSRSSKTLPGGQGLSANAAKRSQGRNNSEPQIPVVPGMITQQNARKKNPVSSFPKFGIRSRSKSFSSLLNTYYSPSKTKKSSQQSPTSDDTTKSTDNTSESSLLLTNSYQSLRTLSGSNWSLLATVGNNKRITPLQLNTESRSASTCDLGKLANDDCFPIFSDIPILEHETRSLDGEMQLSIQDLSQIRQLGRAKHSRHLSRIKRKSLSFMPNINHLSLAPHPEIEVDLPPKIVSDSISKTNCESKISSPKRQLKTPETITTKPTKEPKNEKLKKTQKMDTLVDKNCNGNSVAKNEKKSAIPKSPKVGRDKSNKTKEKSRSLSRLLLPRSKSKPSLLEENQPKKSRSLTEVKIDKKNSKKKEPNSEIIKIETNKAVEKRKKHEAKNVKKDKESLSPNHVKTKTAVGNANNRTKLPPLPYGCTVDNSDKVANIKPSDVKSLRTPTKTRLSKGVCKKCLRNENVLQHESPQNTASVEQKSCDTSHKNILSRPYKSTLNRKLKTGIPSPDTPNGTLTRKSRLIPVPCPEIRSSPQTPVRSLSRSDSITSTKSTSSRQLSTIPTPSPRVRPKIPKPKELTTYSGLQIKTSAKLAIRRSTSLQEKVNSAPTLLSYKTKDNDECNNNYVFAHRPQTLFRPSQQSHLDPQELKIKLQKTFRMPDGTTRNDCIANGNHLSPEINIVENVKDGIASTRHKKHFELILAVQRKSEYSTNTIPRNSAKIKSNSVKSGSLIPKKVLASPATERRFLH
ncbi:rap guanine nucleotide exchange factor 6-like isoform X6 [Styela clava]